MNDLNAIQRCRQGDREAFRHIVERYQAEAIGHSIGILGNREDAMDAVQEAFMDAFRALDRFDTSRRFYPWFYTLLRNRCFKLMAVRQQAEPVLTGEHTIIAPGVSPEESMQLERALFGLSAEQRELITLRHLDGLSYEELAARLNVPIGTVMSRLFHARKRLRELLARKSSVQA
jgi:RNA polymerase sigma-70 factor (ECF subfamily)